MPTPDLSSSQDAGASQRLAKFGSIGRIVSRIGVVLALGLGCGQGDGSETRSAATQFPIAGPAETISAAAEPPTRAEDPQPSVVFIVLDTVRADAVSAYGSVEGTTPNFDRLSERGIRYARAIAPSSWTVSSHATMFSGLRVDQHGVGLAGTTSVPQRVQMLAETFQEAGYVTASFSENTLLSDRFGFEQGFDTFEFNDLVAQLHAQVSGKPAPPSFEILERIRLWNSARDRDRPFFLFVNLLDAHDPYLVRDSNPWLPPNTTAEEAAFVQSKYPIPKSLCDGAPTSEHARILRGLYHGDVAEADRKLGRILSIVEPAQESTHRLTVVTSDHGENFGDHRLMGHQFTVSNSSLHVPLVVAGLPRLTAQVLDAPVELRQVHDSILCWTLGEGCEDTLPVEAENEPASTTAKWERNPAIFSIYSDSVTKLPPWLLDEFGVDDYHDVILPARANCDTDDPVFGDMVSMTRYPFKITWFENHLPLLHDLSWDPAEQSDQMNRQTQIAAALRVEIEAFVNANVVGRERDSETPALDREGVEALKSLGYIQ